MIAGGKRIHGPVMRGLLAALGLIASLTGALAQEFDLPTLRGSESLMPTPPTFTMWRGIYAGGQVSYHSGSADFGTSVNDLAAAAVRNTVLQPVVANLQTLPKSSSNGVGVGAFVGYNTQWEGLVLGFEINYSHTNLNTRSADVVPPLLISNDSGAPPGHHFTYSVDVAGSASIRLTDIATLRARGGWIAGQFLPYAFIGPAIARADVGRSATVAWTRTDTLDPGTVGPPLDGSGVSTQSDVQFGAFFFGYTAGLGLDVFVMPTVFLRGEWEYVQLPDVRGLNFNMNTFRTAVGVKF
jgi:outer membrane immunogenic protein